MCVVSAVMDQWRPGLPSPNIYPSPYPWPNHTGVSVVAPHPQPYSPEDLRKLLDGFHAAVQAARDFDAITGQPDCEDPEKTTLIARVDDLERRLAELQTGRVIHLEGGPLNGDTSVQGFLSNYIDLPDSDAEGRYHLAGQVKDTPGHYRYVWHDER